jgi:chemotaxis protein methyltransferase CheR
MKADDAVFVARLVRERSGLVLTRDKSYLLENRLLPAARALSLRSLDELVERVRAGHSDAIEAAVDAMVPKETAFYRDWTPFKHLRTVVLPNIRAARKKERALRILCAGVSTGQELYSVAMDIVAAGEAFLDWSLNLVGIDISLTALAAAERGRYTQFDVQRGLPVRALLRHFDKVEDDWQIDQALQNMVSFRMWNLLDDLYPLGRFDVVLCRNVLVYFDQQTKIATLQKLSRTLMDDGVLYVGAHETATGVSAHFTPIDADIGVYAVHRDGHPASKSMAIAR